MVEGGLEEQLEYVRTGEDVLQGQGQLRGEQEVDQPQEVARGQALGGLLQIAEQMPDRWVGRGEERPSQGGSLGVQQLIAQEGHSVPAFVAVGLPRAQVDEMRGELGVRQKVLAGLGGGDLQFGQEARIL